MKKVNCLVAFIMVLCTTPGCQRRTVCKSKTPNAGTKFVRVYENIYDTPDDYKAAIDAYKASGYTCDDSDYYDLTKG